MDIAAGIIILKEAGGYIEFLDSNDQNSLKRNIIASNSKIHLETSKKSVSEDIVLDMKDEYLVLFGKFIYDDGEFEKTVDEISNNVNELGTATSNIIYTQRPQFELG